MYERNIKLCELDFEKNFKFFSKICPIFLVSLVVYSVRGNKNDE